MKHKRVEQILEIKARANGVSHSRSLSSEMQSLSELWSRQQATKCRTPEFFPVRAVTIIEETVRRAVAQLVDHGPPFSERAIEISEEFRIKLDFDLLRSINDRTITLGDVVAHSVTPISSLRQICGLFARLLGGDFRECLASTIHQGLYETMGDSAPRMLPDPEPTLAAIDRLFQLRHILVHELPGTPAMVDSEVSSLLYEAEKLVSVVEELVSIRRFGYQPMSQWGMNAAAATEAENADMALEAVLAELKKRGCWSECLEACQALWKDLRAQQIELFGPRDGSLHPLLVSTAWAEITRQRIDDLRRLVTWDASLMWDADDDLDELFKDVSTGARRCP